MLYGFAIAPTINESEPGAAYLRSLESAAKAAVLCKNLDSEDAMALCEYVDCVDGRVLPMDKATYTASVKTLTEYLASTLNTLSANSLANKSWAANTLLALTRAPRNKTARFATAS
jgi:hypothetical protein